MQEMSKLNLLNFVFEFFQNVLEFVRLSKSESVL